jgi:hypothetical protein
MRRHELIETEHAFATRGEMARRRAPHAAEADDDCVKGLAHDLACCFRCSSSIRGN